MPLGVLSLASNLSNEHNVTIFDPPSEGWGIAETISRIENVKPDVLGLSVVTKRVYAMVRILKETSVPYTVVGGPHATYHAEQILRFGAAAVFVGSLADSEFNHAIDDLPKGVIYCDTKINNICFPKRDLLDVKSYFPKQSTLFKANNRLPMFSSIGCPNRCNFCNVQSKKLQFKNAKIILDEMEYLESLGCGSVHILDDNFNVSRNHLIHILDEMDRRDYYCEWSGRGQVKMDFSLLSRLVEHGFKRIHVGIEAVDDKILWYFNKPQTTADIYRFCYEMNEYGIDVLGYFIMGSPVETDEYRNSLADRIKELNIKFPFFNVLFPEPNTGYYQQLLDEGIYKVDYWREYMVNPTPDYEIPYPYGDEKRQKIWNCIENLIGECYGG